MTFIGKDPRYDLITLTRLVDEKTSKEQKQWLFDTLYAVYGLETIEEKIEWMQDTMGILATRY